MTIAIILKIHKKDTKLRLIEHIVPDSVFYYNAEQNNSVNGLLKYWIWQNVPKIVIIGLRLLFIAIKNVFNQTYTGMLQLLQCRYMRKF